MIRYTVQRLPRDTERIDQLRSGNFSTSVRNASNPQEAVRAAESYQVALRTGENRYYLVSDGTFTHVVLVTAPQIPENNITVLG